MISRNLTMISSEGEQWGRYNLPSAFPRSCNAAPLLVSFLDLPLPFAGFSSPGGSSYMSWRAGDISWVDIMGIWWLYTHIYLNHLTTIRVIPFELMTTLHQELRTLPSFEHSTYGFIRFIPGNKNQKTVLETWTTSFPKGDTWLGAGVMVQYLEDVRGILDDQTRHGDGNKQYMNRLG